MRRGKVGIEFGLAASHHGTGGKLALHGLGQLYTYIYCRREGATGHLGLHREGFHHGNRQQEQHIDPTPRKEGVERLMENTPASPHHKMVDPVIEEEVKEWRHWHYITAAVTSVPEGEKADIGQQESEERETEIFTPSIQAP